MKKIILLIITNVLSISASAETLKVGIISGPSQKLLKIASAIAQKQYHLTIEPIIFTDYQFPNEALNNKDLDANFFQTQEFLDAAVTAKNYKIKAVAKSFIYPMGIYSKKIKSLKELKPKSIVVIPTGASNQSRALLLLQKSGLIKLRNTNKAFYTPHDVIENNQKLKFFAINGPQMPHYVIDADIIVLNNDFVLAAKLQFKDALFTETIDGSAKYVNVLVSHSESKKEKQITELISVLHSKEYENATYQYYPDALKAW